MTDPHAQTRAELSALHDEGGRLSGPATAHLAECTACAGSRRISSHAAATPGE